jgi:hypothetical protein
MQQQENLQVVVELISHVLVLRVVLDPRVAGDEGILCADVERVVDLPVDVADLSRGMEQALECVLEDLDGSEGDSETFDCVHKGLHQMR